MIDAVHGGGLIAALHRATHVSLRHLGSSLTGLGLGGAEINALAVLSDGAARSVGALAAATGTKSGTLTSVLDRLARKNLVSRAVDQDDRRSVVIALTPGGRRAAAAVQSAVADLEHAVRARVSAAELAGFHAVADALAEVSR